MCVCVCVNVRVCECACVWMCVCVNVRVHAVGTVDAPKIQNVSEAQVNKPPENGAWDIACSLLLSVLSVHELGYYKIMLSELR